MNIYCCTRRNYQYFDILILAYRRCKLILVFFSLFTNTSIFACCRPINKYYRVYWTATEGVWYSLVAVRAWRLHQCFIRGVMRSDWRRWSYSSCTSSWRSSRWFIRCCSVKSSDNCCSHEQCGAAAWMEWGESSMCVASRSTLAFTWRRRTNLR